MASFFYWIYRQTQANRLLFAGLLIIIVALAIYQSLQLKFQENIVNIIPKDDGIDKITQTFEGFEMNKRLVFHLYSEDVRPDELINISTKYCDSLISTSQEYIDNIKKEIPDQQLLDLFNYYYENIPYYLKDEDYDKISDRITVNGIDTSLNQVLKSLISPLGAATKMMRLKDPIGLTGFPLKRTNELQLDDNIGLYKNHLFSKDQKHLLYFVKLINPPTETSQNEVILNNIESLIKHFNTQEVKIEYFGAPAVAVSNAQRIKTDILYTVSLALLCLFIFISLFYKRIAVFFIAITPGIFGGLIAITILSLYNEHVSIISLGVGSVLLGITVDYALHLFTHAKKQKEVRKLFEDLTSPLIMSSCTTACAFFSLMFIRSSALQDLGIFTGISVIAATVYTLVVLPHFILDNNDKTNENWVEKFIRRVSEFNFQSKWILIIVLAISLISYLNLSNVAFESNMLGLNYMPEKLKAYENRLNQISNYTVNNIYLSTSGNDIWEALDKNADLLPLLYELKSDSTIVDYVSLNLVIPTLRTQNKRLSKWKNFWDSNNKKEFINQFNHAALKLGFKENTFGTFDSLVIKDYDNIEIRNLEKITNILGEDLIINNSDGTVSLLTVIKLPTENKNYVFDELESFSNITILDRGYVTSKLVKVLKEDFNTLVNSSLLIVFFILLVCYGRIELAIITFTPIVLSWLWVLGLMGLFDLEFNIVNIIVCTFIFGLGIDYSIFVMRGLTQKNTYGTNNLISYKKSILLSFITTLLGIGALAFAQHPALQSIALLAIIGIVSVIIITFSVEHLLFDLLIGNRKKKGVVPFTLFSLITTIIAFTYFMLGCLILQILRIIFQIPVGPIKSKKLAFHYVMMKFCGSLIYLMMNFRKKFIDKSKLDFTSPSVIIANHHSFIDILILLMLNPRVVMVTNDWVYNSPFFGKAVQFADFILATEGVEYQLEKIESLIADGYSIMVFPEGTRTGKFELGRFHKGAFFLAEKFKLDIQPVILHGTNLVMPKGDDFYLKNNLVTIKVLDRIVFEDERFGVGYKERSKNISKYFKSEYQKVRDNTESPKFFREILIKNYLYKGPVLEWYVRIKTRLENDYQLFNELIPKKSKIIDLGCGYGIMSFALAMSSSERQIKGVDYDNEKIQIANHCPSKPNNLTFEHGDVTSVKLDKSDIILISDVLHYLSTEEQNIVLGNALSNLNEGGLVIIRDGDSNKTKRHTGTKLTEFFSTNLGFNKTRNKLNFISFDFVNNFAITNNLKIKTIDNTSLTSNTVYVLSRT